MAKRNRGPYLSSMPNEHGHYEIRWSEDGRSRRRSTGCTDPADGNKVLAAFVLGFDEKRSGPGPLTIARCLYDYWIEHASKVVSIETTAYAIRALMRGLDGFDPPFRIKDADKYIETLALRAGGRLVSSLTPADISGRFDAAGKLSRPGYVQHRGISDGSMRRELGVLIAAIKHAHTAKRISADDLPKIPLPPEPPPNDYWLTDAETARLLAEAYSAEGALSGRLTRVYRFVALARYTAARKAAIEGLTWFQVDMTQRTIAFNPEGRAQTKKRRPKVPIANVLWPIIKRAHDERVNEFVLDHDGDTRGAFETASRKAGLPDCTPHVLRHTWATRAAQLGVPLWEIAGVLDDTLDTVTKRYLHHCPEHLRAAVNAGHDPGITPGGADLVSGIDHSCPTPAKADQ